MIIMSGKKTACLLGVLYCFVIIFSAVFIAVEAVHDCTGEGCPICFGVVLCVETIKQAVNFSWAFSTFVGFLLFVSFLKFLCASVFCCAYRTPVSLKIKLSN